MIANLLSMLILGLATQVQGPTGFPSRAITLEIRGKLLGPALEQLSQSTGLKLLLSPKLAGEPVVLSVHQKPTSEVLTLLARVLEAEWQKEPAGWRLVRSPEFERACDQRRDAIQAEKIAKFQEDLRKSLEKWSEFDAAAAAGMKSSLAALSEAAKSNHDAARALYSRLDSMQERSPMDWLCKSLLAKSDPKLIAGLRPYSRIVFVERPNPNQVAMPREFRQLLESFASKWERWRDAIQPLSLWFLGQGSKPERFGLPKQDPAQQAKVIFAINRPDYSNPGYAEVLLIDGTGAVLEKATVQISGVNPLALDRAAIDARNTGSEPLKLSPLGQECVQRVEKRLKTIPALSDQPLSPGLRDILLHLDARDLAETLVSDLVLGKAAAEGVDVIAAPGWHAPLTASYILARGPMTSSGFDRQLGTRWFAMQAKPELSWLLIEPMAPQTSYREGGLRSTLSPIIRKVLGGGRPTLDEQAAYAVTNKNWSAVAHLVIASSFLAPWPDFQVPFGFELDFLKLHGTLTPKQREGLETGNQMPLSSIQASARDLVAHYVLQSGAKLQRGTPKSKRKAEAKSGSEVPEAVEFLQYYEPSEIFRSGIPQSSLLSRMSKEALEFEMCSKKRPGGIESLTVQELAWGVLNPNNQLSYIAYEPGDSMLRARRWREYTYVVEFGSGFYIEATLRDVLDATPWVGSWEKLPAQYAKAIQLAIEEEKKHPRGIEVGGTIPPN